MDIEEWDEAEGEDDDDLVELLEDNVRVVNRLAI